MTSTGGTGALAQAAQTLTDAPGDLAALALVAAELRAVGKKAEAAKAFDALSRAAREDGQVALAIYGARAAAELGGASATALVSKIAAAYGAGSKRVDASVRARPPAPPKKASGAGPAAAAGPAPAPAPADVVTAVALAVAAVTRAGERADAAEQQAGKLPAVPLVATLPPKNLEQLVAVMRPSVRKPGEVVVDVGEEASALFLIARGALKVSRGAHELGRLRPGAFFGEIALLGGTRRTARVECEEETWLLEIPRAALEAAAARAPGLADTLAAYARTRLLGNTMRTSEVFRRLAPEEREQLVARFEPRVFDSGATILREGEEGDRLHVVVSGEVEVRRAGAPVARLAAGDLFGEMSLFQRKAAAADVVAVGRAVTLSLDRPKFNDIAVKHPELLAEVYKTLLSREQANLTASAAETEVSADDAEEIIL